MLVNFKNQLRYREKIIDRMEIFDANVGLLIQQSIEQNTVVMSSEPTAGSLHVHATNCLFQTLNTKDKLETCLIEMCRNDFTRVFMTFINW